MTGNARGRRRDGERPRAARQPRPGAAPGQRRRWPGGGSGWQAARSWYDGSLARSFFSRLKELDFSGQTMLFGAGLLISLLPLAILASSFASHRLDEDIALLLGLNQRAASAMSPLIKAGPAKVDAATVSSAVFLAAGVLAVIGSLQQMYQKAFRQEGRGLREAGRLAAWLVALCAVLVALGAAERPASRVSPWLGPPVTAVITAPFFWWTMHFLLAGRVRWRELAPSAVMTAILYAGLGVFSRFYFSATIVSDSRAYGTIGSFFAITTWLIAVGAVAILGAVAGVVWQERHGGARPPAAAAGAASRGCGPGVSGPPGGEPP